MIISPQNFKMLVILYEEVKADKLQSLAEAEEIKIIEIKQKKYITPDFHIQKKYLVQKKFSKSMDNINLYIRERGRIIETIKGIQKKFNIVT